MKLLVTGGAGFIGSNFIRLVLGQRSGWEILNFDKLTYAGNSANLQDLESTRRYRLVCGDIRDRTAVRAALDGGFDAVVNFAAESHVDRSLLDACSFVETNALGTQVLLDVCRELGVPRFVQVSTDEVYGSCPSGQFGEEATLRPSSPYSASKAAADLLALACHHSFGQQVMITRCTNNYGPYQFPEKLIPLMILEALGGRRLPVYGDGANVRDWIHVQDHCTGVLAVLEGGKAGEVYHIGGNCERTNLEVVRLILETLGKPADLIQYVKDRPGHDRRYALSTAKIQRELGWAPEISFEEGLRQTIGWYQSHSEWVESIRSGDYRRYMETMYTHRDTTFGS
ncbi:MAG: dTDP-glucose 4,6-dehydratase [Acidobacteriota bacterium]